jgi:hypothetical protein
MVFPQFLKKLAVGEDRGNAQSRPGNVNFRKTGRHIEAVDLGESGCRENKRKEQDIQGRFSGTHEIPPLMGLNDFDRQELFKEKNVPTTCGSAIIEKSGG